jgi:hypothetical protein
MKKIKVESHTRKPTADVNLSAEKYTEIRTEHKNKIKRIFIGLRNVAKKVPRSSSQAK